MTHLLQAKDISIALEEKALTLAMLLLHTNHRASLRGAAYDILTLYEMRRTALKPEVTPDE